MSLKTNKTTRKPVGNFEFIFFFYLPEIFGFHRSPASAKSFNATTSAKPSQPPTATAKHHPHLPGQFSPSIVLLMEKWKRNTHSNNSLRCLEADQKLSADLISLIKQYYQIDGDCYFLLSFFKFIKNSHVDSKCGWIIAVWTLKVKS